MNNRRHKAVHIAVKTMDSKITIQHNKHMYLEDSMVMYSIYKAGTLDQLIIQYITFTTLQHLMNKYLWDSVALQYFDPYMQMHKAYNTIP